MKTDLQCPTRAILLLPLIMHQIFGARYYLLSFPANNKSSMSVPRKLINNCIKPMPNENKPDRCPIRDGWRLESGYWKLDEQNLGDGCCSLESLDIPFPPGFPRLSKLRVEVVGQLFGTRCRGDDCFDTLKVCMESGRNDVGCKDMKLYKKDFLNDKKNIAYNSELNLKEHHPKTAALKLITSEFYGVVKKVLFYFDYCPAKRLGLVIFPAASTKTNVTGQCISNAVVSNSTKLSHECDPSSRSTYSGFCVCDKGFQLINASCKG